MARCTVTLKDHGKVHFHPQGSWQGALSPSRIMARCDVTLKMHGKVDCTLKDHGKVHCHPQGALSPSRIMARCNVTLKDHGKVHCHPHGSWPGALSPSRIMTRCTVTLKDHGKVHCHPQRSLSPSRIMARCTVTLREHCHSQGSWQGALSPSEITVTLRDHCHPQGSWQGALSPSEITVTLKDHGKVHCHPQRSLLPSRIMARCTVALKDHDKVHCQPQGSWQGALSASRIVTRCTVSLKDHGKVHCHPQRSLLPSRIMARCTVTLRDHCHPQGSWQGALSPSEITVTLKDHGKPKELIKWKEESRPYTISIALPGSILDNAQSPELRTYLAGQIARAAVVFNIDEIVVTTEGEFKGVGKHGQGNVQLARILQYLECPQYLRKSFFPQHKDLQYAGRFSLCIYPGVLNPLDCPHHMRAQDEAVYREGVVLNKPPREGRGSFVNIGLTKDVQIDKHLKAGVRVTVKIDPATTDRKNMRGTVVSPSEPRTQAGLYWGYTVRLAGSLGAVFTESPYPETYDLTIGTSERGTDLDEFSLEDADFNLESDEQLGVEDPSLLFQHYLNTCPQQGSRTIRTEEAILITMAGLRPKLFSKRRQNPES
ncbi:CI114-like protein [Mya arenaria]|uniref:CI114-like protein n=1 Tax=Mya arenaria TaxID=6604 RepID=A0ABY7FAW2_MYAAR|nr:CI114-like protein [Mya arenaria]